MPKDASDFDTVMSQVHADNPSLTDDQKNDLHAQAYMATGGGNVSSDARKLIEYHAKRYSHYNSTRGTPAQTPSTGEAGY